jgi:putative transposase
VSRSKSEVYYHFVWSTKYRNPCITRDIESFLFNIVREKCAEYKVNLIAINAVEDHVHMLIRSRSSVGIASFMHSVKGASAHLIRVRLGLRDFQWQASYGVFSVCKKCLAGDIGYIKIQKMHHKNKESN